LRLAAGFYHRIDHNTRRLAAQPRGKKSRRATWRIAVSDCCEVVRLKREAQAAVEAAQAARAEAALRVELLRQELTETRQALAARDTALATMTTPADLLSSRAGWKLSLRPPANAPRLASAPMPRRSPPSRPATRPCPSSCCRKPRTSDAVQA
jgi:hypothetical protein